MLNREIQGLLGQIWDIADSFWTLIVNTVLYWVWAWMEDFLTFLLLTAQQTSWHSINIASAGCKQVADESLKMEDTFYVKELISQQSFPIIWTLRNHIIWWPMSSKVLFAMDHFLFFPQIDSMQSGDVEMFDAATLSPRNPRGWEFISIP